MTKTHLQRLDDLVRWTGIPALAEHKQRRRRLTLLPTLALVAATTGLVMKLVSPDRYAIGYGLLMLGFSIANFMPIFGPLVPIGGPERVDEREGALRRSALLVGLAAMGGTAIVGLWVLVALALLKGLTVEQLVHDMTALAFYLMALYGALPTLWASWRLRPLPDEDD